MTADYFRDDIPALHLITLRSSAALLQRDFSGTFATETIERFLITSFDEFASRLTNDTDLERGRAPRRPLPVHAQRRAVADGEVVLPCPCG